MLAELGAAKMRFVPGDSLGATLVTRRECVSFQVTVSGDEERLFLKSHKHV